jgi:hypothetical protein
MSNLAPEYWKKCNTCKKPIGFNTPYQVCSVSSCNLKRNTFIFCSVSCWAAHVPVYRHRDAWALEKKSPSREEFLKENNAKEENNAEGSTTPTPKESVAMNSPTRKATPKEVLVVVSKLKDYIKQSADMNTSAEVIEVLSEKIRSLCDQACIRARQEGRKTLMARDFFKGP